MRKLLSNNKVIALLILLPLSTLAHGQGGSGSGGCGSEPLQIAAIKGTPQELENEIDRGIAFATEFGNKNPKLLSHPIYQKFSIWITPEIISQPINNKRTIFINWWSGCESTSLLELAAAGGNQSNAQYLLDSGGNPNIVDGEGSYGGNTIFMRCANLSANQDSRLSVNGVPHSTRTMMEAKAKIAVYSQLLSKGGNLSLLSAQGLSALHLCKDPEAIAFFLKNGANPNLPVEHNSREPRKVNEIMSTPVLDYRIKRIVEDYFWERDSNFNILQQLLPVIKNKTLERETLWRICDQCSNPHKAETCNRLSKMVIVPDQDIFRGKEKGAENEVALQKCRKYSIFQ